MRYSANLALERIQKGNVVDYRSELCEVIACFSVEGNSLKKIAGYLNICKIPPITRAQKWGRGSVRIALREYCRNNPVM